MRGNSFCAEVDKISLHTAYYFSALKNSVVYEPPLQEKKMQRRLTTRQALEMILSEVNPCDSDGEDIELQPDSDSELSDLSSDEETAPQPKKRARLGTDLTETAKDGTVWREEQVGTRLPFTPIKAYAADGEPMAKARKSISSRLQSFLCFITLDMLHSIQEWTIQHAQQKEHVHWFMALPELMAFIAIVILRGLTKVSSLRDCWSANLGNPHIIRTIPQKTASKTSCDTYALMTGPPGVINRKTTILGTVNKIRREIPQSARHTDRNELTTQVVFNHCCYADGEAKHCHPLQHHKVRRGCDGPDGAGVTVRTGTRRWPVAMFYNMIDMAALNAHVLYQACTGRQERWVDFLVELARELANSHMCAKKARKEQLLSDTTLHTSPGKRAMCQESNTNARTIMQLCEVFTATDTHVVVVN
ncbi:uncharacterized protein LOC122140081 [Cyprinus carpio]|uniref:Uncharacterized protein LOC122140081 n=1 Tax=Cyprinus carpio TaxID=7962 RepID=A0A9Q9XAZ5_CYPCA|nr:uncharacterized protein LOC122140081 [Cyprinus carpio]